MSQNNKPSSPENPEKIHQTFFSKLQSQTHLDTLGDRFFEEIQAHLIAPLSPPIDKQSLSDKKDSAPQKINLKKLIPLFYTPEKTQPESTAKPAPIKEPRQKPIPATKRPTLTTSVEQLPEKSPHSKPSGVFINKIPDIKKQNTVNPIFKPLPQDKKIVLDTTHTQEKQGLPTKKTAAPSKLSVTKEKTEKKKESLSPDLKTRSGVDLESRFKERQKKIEDIFKKDSHGSVL